MCEPKFSVTLEAFFSFLFFFFLVFHYLGQLAIKQHLIIHKRENSGERLWVVIWP